MLSVMPYVLATEYTTAVTITSGSIATPETVRAALEPAARCVRPAVTRGNGTMALP